MGGPCESEKELGYDWVSLKHSEDQGRNAEDNRMFRHDPDGTDACITMGS